MPADVDADDLPADAADRLREDDLDAVGEAWRRAADRARAVDEYARQHCPPLFGLPHDAPLATTPRVKVYALPEVTVDGRRHRLTAAQWRAVKALADAHAAGVERDGTPGGLTVDGLIAASGAGGAVRTVKTLAERPGWRDVIVVPRKRGRGGYRLR